MKRLEIQGYRLNPSYAELARMTEDEFQEVRNFSISNEHGKIEWEDPIDLYTVLNGKTHDHESLSDIIEIRPGSITVYIDDGNKPNAGSGLNKPALLELYNLYPPEIQEKLVNKMVLKPQEIQIFDKFKDGLRNKVHSKGAKFIDYTGHDGKLMFYVD